MTDGFVDFALTVGTALVCSSAEVKNDNGCDDINDDDDKINCMLFYQCHSDIESPLFFSLSLFFFFFFPGPP